MTVPAAGQMSSESLKLVSAAEPQMREIEAENATSYLHLR